MKALALAVQTIALALCIQTPLWSQNSCPSPDTHQVVPGVNIFNAQQEVYLGDAIDASLRQDLTIEDDADVTARLQAVVDHLAEVLPPSLPKFRVSLVELSTANAFSTVGGRIYMSRKLIALTQNEDELAYVLAHEMGHLVSEHTALATSDGFAVVLGVKQVGDEKDVVDKWNEYLSNRRRAHASGSNIRRAEKIEQATQVQADSVAVYLVTRGGYNPRAAAVYFDRLADTKGNVGGFWSDLFGKTTEDSKRLREMLQNATPMPASCAQPRPGAATGYIAWRDSVINFTATRNAEVIPGLIRKRALTQRLAPAINAIHISPDGKYVLAQDDSGMFVLTREPLKPIFHILAWEAKPAMFTPDSQSIVYSIGGFGESPRVEKWNIASQQRTEVHEIHVAKGCLNPSLSPDGKNLACIINPGSTDTFRLDLVVYDTATGTEAWRRNNWWSPGIMTGGYLESLNLVFGAEKRWEHELPIRFSPDGRYLVAHALLNSVGVDLASRSTISLANGIKNLMEQNIFTFLGNDRFIGLKDGYSGNARIVKFPSGETVADDLYIGNATPSSVMRGNYIALRPLKKNHVGLMDITRKEIVVAGRNTGLDVWDNSCITELVDGAIANFDLSTNKTAEQVQLPQAPLARLTAGGASSDLNWLAMSQRTRGGVWNLQNGKLVYRVMGFGGTYFDPAALYADFYKVPDSHRTVGELSLPTPHFEAKQTLEDKIWAWQSGKYLVENLPQHEKDWEGNVTTEIHDIRDGKVLWSKQFSEIGMRESITAESHVLVLYWPAASKAFNSLVKDDPDAAAKLKAYHDKEGILFVQVIDLENGKVQSTTVLDTGKNSFRIESIKLAGSRLIIADSQNRVSLYSLEGKRLASVPGRSFHFSSDKLLVDEDSQSERLSLYDLSTLEKRAQYVFGSPVIVAEFSGDGKQLLIATADQTVYLLDPTASSAASGLSAKQ
jgi:hypothetical protein